MFRFPADSAGPSCFRSAGRRETTRTSKRAPQQQMRRLHRALENPAKRPARAHRRRPPGHEGRRRRAGPFVGLAMLDHAAPPVATADRVALVIGNSAREHNSELPNPVNDATAMRALTRLGFDVVFRRNADEDAMEDALGAFEGNERRRQSRARVLRGHGMEMNGANYPVRVDARLSSVAAVGRETVALDDALTAVTQARARIVIRAAFVRHPLVSCQRRNRVVCQRNDVTVARGSRTDRGTGDSDPNPPGRSAEQPSTHYRDTPLA